MFFLLSNSKFPLLNSNICDIILRKNYKICFLEKIYINMGLCYKSFMAKKNISNILISEGEKNENWNSRFTKCRQKYNV